MRLQTELTVTFHVVNSIDDVMNSIDYRQVSLRLVHSQILIPVPRTRVHGSLRSRSTYIIFNWDGSAISLISAVTSCGASCDSVFLFVFLFLRLGILGISLFYYIDLFIDTLVLSLSSCSSLWLNNFMDTNCLWP